MYRYYLLPSLRSLLGIAALIGALLFSSPADAAESVVLKYRFLRETVSVAELSTFAETGELSSSLRAYLKLAGKEPEALRNALTQETQVNGILLSRILNSPVGEVMLDRASEVIHTPSDRANRESLRSALVLSALPDNSLTLIEVLENYPTPDVEVEADRLLEIVKYIRRVIGNLPSLPLF
ncbi:MULTISPECIES: alpha/beta hydrolase [unclassified Coleofasciculus]|uniref:alpha/beta hydrolase n=1 Tax=unclassified Coleofasciculus TaxID=2692782 RepID=UPI00188047FE|nr:MULTISPECIES: alpha/beta hydrolase [unclassified Coleofasciculus]MBE9124800.1 alpha/beta hydrolase [Coleofasciculus sp. LEGE 07081]MBE9147705.1 alpha/beta hydrolase [Coleofasciculus sp. LEGE 07092]